jgi:hypothetical protein
MAPVSEPPPPPQPKLEAQAKKKEEIAPIAFKLQSDFERRAETPAPLSRRDGKRKKRDLPVPIDSPPTNSKNAPSKTAAQDSGLLPGRNQLLLLLILGIAVLIAVVLAIIFTFSQDRQKEIDRLAAIADLKSVQIDIWFKERKGDAEYVGSSPYLQELAANWRQHGDRAARYRLIERVQQTQSAYGYEGCIFSTARCRRCRALKNRRRSIPDCWPPSRTP